MKADVFWFSRSPDINNEVFFFFMYKIIIWFSTQAEQGLLAITKRLKKKNERKKTMVCQEQLKPQKIMQTQLPSCSYRKSIVVFVMPSWPAWTNSQYQNSHDKMKVISRSLLVWGENRKKGSSRLNSNVWVISQ